MLDISLIKQNAKNIAKKTMFVKQFKLLDGVLLDGVLQAFYHLP